MEDNLFDTPEKRASAVLLFESLEAHLGWQLIVSIVRANIEVLRKALEDGVQGQTMEDVQRLRDKIKDHENFINTPTTLRTQFTSEYPKVPESDPYDKGEVLDK